MPSESIAFTLTFSRRRPAQWPHTSSPLFLWIITPAPGSPSEENWRILLLSLIHSPKESKDCSETHLRTPFCHICPNSLVILHKSTVNWGSWILLQESSHSVKGNPWVRKVIPEDLIRSFLKDFEIKGKILLWFWANEESWATILEGKEKMRLCYSAGSLPGK